MPETNPIIDGILQKKRNNFIYLQFDNKKKSPAAIKLTKETVYSEILLSLTKKAKLIKEKKIKLSDFKVGDRISVVLEKAGSRDKITLAVRRVVIKK